MQIAGKVVVVTGGANGIGRALSERFAAEDARAVVIADIDGARSREVADRIGGIGLEVDVARETDVQRLVHVVLERLPVWDAMEELRLQTETGN